MHGAFDRQGGILSFITHRLGARRRLRRLIWTGVLGIAALFTSSASGATATNHHGGLP